MDGAVSEHDLERYLRRPLTPAGARRCCARSKPGRWTRAARSRPRRARPPARPRSRCRARPAGALPRTAPATSRSRRRCRESAARWSTGGSTGIPAIRSATASGTRARTSRTRSSAPRSRGAKAHWGTVHHPVEDVGLGTVHARIAFLAPSAMGFSGDALSDPRVATIVCGYAGDDRRRVRHTPMVHVFLRTDDGVLAAQPLLARRRDAPLRARAARGARRAACSTRARCASARCRAACRARWPATARRSTRTSPRSCRSCTPASPRTRPRPQRAATRARPSRPRRPPR